MSPMPEPPADRPAKMRWGWMVALVLAGLAIISVWLPTLGGARKDVVALMRATRVHRALMLHAAEHEGRFPEGLTNSNEAFRPLFRDYLNDETLFHVPGSAWHDAAPGGGPDNIIGLHPPYERALQKGENHWAYVSGLRDASDGHLPLLADGFVEGAPGIYTDDPSKKGGMWKGTKAIVVLVSGAAQTYGLSRKTGFRVLRRDAATGTETDLFERAVASPGAAAVRVLNPE